MPLYSAGNIIKHTISTGKITNYYSEPISNPVITSVNQSLKYTIVVFRGMTQWAVVC